MEMYRSSGRVEYLLFACAEAGMGLSARQSGRYNVKILFCVRIFVP